MKTKKLLRRTSVLLFALLSACLLYVNVNAQKKAFNATGKIYGIIQAKEISDALSKAAPGKINLNIYPVKLYDNSTLELKTSFEDTKTLKTNLGKAVPVIYYVPVDKAFLENISAVSFYYSPYSKKMEYFRLVDSASKTDMQSKTDEQSKTGSKTDDQSKADAQASRDSTPNCKCPPECCLLAVATRGTALKCPDNCPEDISISGSANKMAANKKTNKNKKAIAGELKKSSAK